ncbi:caspase b-like [Astyanax mexicanus]|uniref:caspase b-like n=1 Tax=Astyanax mexicanus TaxID=7994 RepID=UPI0020CAB825|nr:caspase b-like [Astyanax mexicanus]
MTTICKVLKDILDELTGKDFKRFKWYMTDGKLNDITSIARSKLENTSVEDTVDLMIDQYKQDAGEVAEKILKNMEQNNLAEQLKNKLSEVQRQAAEGSTVPPGPGAPAGPGVQQTITASESSKVHAPVMSGGQYNAPVTFNFN